MRITSTGAAALIAGAVLATGLVVAGTLGASNAFAGNEQLAAATPSPPGPSPSARPQAPGQPPGHMFRGGPGRGFGMFGGRALHGEVVVEKPGGGTQTVVFQQGTVSAKSADSVTVKSTDGFTLTWTVGSSTRVSSVGGGGGLAGLAIGDSVMASGTKSAGGADTTLLAERGAFPGRFGQKFGDRNRTPSPSPTTQSSSTA